MKVVMLNGQNHKGSTYHMGRLLIDQLPGTPQVTEFFLPKDLPHFCSGCYACVEDEARCPYAAEKGRILQAIEQADLLIVTTPNYCMAPSAPLKAFIDLTFTYWGSHKPRACMFAKRAIVLSTTAGAGTKQAIKPVKTTLACWGVPWVKSCGVAVQAMNWAGVSAKKKAAIEKKMGRLAKAAAHSGRPRVPIKTKLLFWMMRKMQQANWGSGPTEKAYWQQHGWLGKERPWKQLQPQEKKLSTTP